MLVSPCVSTSEPKMRRPLTPPACCEHACVATWQACGHGVLAMRAAFQPERLLLLTRLTLLCVRLLDLALNMRTPLSEVT